MVCLPVLASAQIRETSIYDEQGKLLRGSDVVGTLGPDLFGDQVSLYTGSLEFVQTDVSIPGNSALPVSIGRRFVVAENAYMGHHFGDWALEIPRAHGVFTATRGWTVPLDGGVSHARCSRFGVPPSEIMGAGHAAVTVTGSDYWQGSFIYIPGQGDQEILRRATANTPPSNGGAYPLTTKSGGMIRCIPMANQDNAEGFELLTPDGSIYRFDYQISHDVSRLIGSNSEIPGSSDDEGGEGGGAGDQDDPPDTRRAPWDLLRREVWIVPTLITDRYGNTVSYSWSGRRLTAITGTANGFAKDDDRVLTLEYYPNTDLVWKVHAAVGDGTTRTWTYVYDNGGLGRVVQPDGRMWTYAMLDLYRQDPIASIEESTCDGSLFAPKGPYFGTMTHPSGATGTFQVDTVEHGRTWVLRECANTRTLTGGAVIYQGSWSRQPRHFANLALTKKTLSGIGLPGYTWEYLYNETIGSISYCWDPASSSPPALPAALNYMKCTASSPTTKTVKVTKKDAGATVDVTRYTFGIRSRVNEGQLLKTETMEANGTSVVRTVSTDYTPPATPPWPVPVGTSIQERGDKYMTERLLPERERVTVQDGATFRWQAQTFDHRARPLQVVRARDGGRSITETTAYHDNTQYWILGQIGQVSANETGAGGATPVPVFNTYDAAGKLETHTRFGKLYRTYRWHNDGTLWQSMDGRGSGFTSFTTTYAQYKRGIPRAIAFATGDWIRSQVNDTGEITSVTQDALPDFTSVTTGYQYDLMGRLKQVDYPSESPNWYPTTLSFAPQYTSELNGTHWVQTVSQGNAQTLTYFDALWRPVLTRRQDVTDPNKTRRMMLTRYDADGRPKFQSYPQRLISLYALPPGGEQHPGTTTTYDVLGRVRKSTIRTEPIPAPNGPTSFDTVISYQPGFVKWVTNPRGFTTKTTFQALDEPVEDTPLVVELPDGVKIEYTRDIFGKPTELKQYGNWSGGSQTSTRGFAYNGHQLLCRTVDPESGATLIGYDAADNVTWRATGQPSGASCTTAPPPLNRTTLTYDGRNRTTGASYSDGSPGKSWTWTQDGQLKTLTSGASMWTYGYNQRRLLTGETLSYAGTNYAFTYQYDAHGNAWQLRYPDASLVNYAPNALGEPTIVSGYANGIEYHPNGGLYKFMYGNGIWHETLQNARGLPGWSTDVGVIDDEYSYDANGNVTRIEDVTPTPSTALGPNLTRTMQYDGRDRLTQVSFLGQSSLSATYGYDALDNLRSAVGTGRNRTYGYDAANRLTSISNSAVAETGTYQYADGRGNVTTRSIAGAGVPYPSNHALVYDAANRLISATPQPSGSATTYGYDGHDRRVASTPPGGVTKLSMYSKAGQLLSEVRTNGVGQVNYIYLGRHLLARTPHSRASGGLGTAPPKFFQHTDGLVTPIGVTSASGVLQSQRSLYEAYGDKAGLAESDGPGYTGHVADSLTGLTYMQARFYDPVAGRFLSIDPAAADIGNFNRYWYANNNPYRFVDPDGRAVVSANPANSAKLLKHINSRALGVFKFDENNNLSAVSANGNSSKYSATYRDRLVEAINSDKIITLDIGKTTVLGDGSTLDVVNDAGGGATDAWSNGNSSVTISGLPDSYNGTVTSPSDILMHELVGHAIPNAVGGGTGNAVDNENIVRSEIGLPLRPREPDHIDKN